MMSISDVLVSGILLVIVLFLIVGFFDYILPLYKKYQFDSICRNYAWINEAQNGMDSSEVSALKEELLDIGVSDVSIEFVNKGNASRKDWINFKVEVKYVTGQFKGLFQRAKVALVFKYETKVMARRIVN